MKNRVVILLTACVNPNGMAYTVLQDKDVRLRQYRDALDWYLSHVENKIVFVENTGYDISPLYENSIKSGKLEVLTFHGNDYDKSRGKGYGEALIMDYAIKNSFFLQGDVNIMKITGRLICENVERMSRSYRGHECVYALLMRDPYGNLEFNSQVFVAPISFFSYYFLPRKEELNDGKCFWFEHLLYHATQHWKKDGYMYKEMWIPFNIRGVSGSGGTSVDSAYLNNKMSFYLHYLLHRFNYYGPLRFWHKKKMKNI